ncbi:hypothetical protein [Enterococcus asini]|uniref:hypothetical protein n=1 Tax=Enterococcus asini TaxID=57732 RepID=UPI0022E83C90|nr:hypothetical protein [Enterococcus asini]
MELEETTQRTQDQSKGLGLLMARLYTFRQLMKLAEMDLISQASLTAAMGSMELNHIKDIDGCISRKEGKAMVMKEGSVINNYHNRNEKRDTISWIKDAINILAKYQNLVALDEVRVLDGEACVADLAPSSDKHPSKSVTITFEFIETPQ